MFKYLVIIGLLGLGLISGYWLGTNKSFEVYPYVIDPNPPFVPTATQTGKIDNQQTVYLNSFSSNEPDQYLYASLNVSCSDINIYSLAPDQTLATSQPIAIIEGQDIDCNQSGSYLSYDQVVPNQQLVLQSDTPISGAYYLAIEGDNNA